MGYGLVVAFRAVLCVNRLRRRAVARPLIAMVFLGLAASFVKDPLTRP
jgi:hypothetical protein